MTLVHAEGFDALSNAILWATYGSSQANSGLVAVDTTAPRTGRNCLKVGGGSTSIVGASKSIASADQSATLIVGVAMYKPATGVAGIVLLGDSGGTSHTVLRVNASGGFELLRGTTTSFTTLASSSSGLVPANTWTYIEAKFVLSDTVGSVEVRTNGNPTPVFTATNLDTKNAGTATVYDTVQLYSVMSSGNFTYFDDWTISNVAGSDNNDFTGDKKVVCLLPNGAGSVTQLSTQGSATNYQNVDDTATNTSDYNYGSTSGNKDLYAMENLTNAGTIYGVVSQVYAQKSDAGARAVAPVQKSGSTTTVGTANYLSLDPTLVTELRELNPATGLAYTTTEINAIEMGAQIA